MFTPIYTVRVQYKSGTFVDFECLKYNFSLRIDGSKEFSYTIYGHKKPIHMNLDEIESVWQLSYRNVLSFCVK